MLKEHKKIKIITTNGKDTILEVQLYEDIKALKILECVCKIEIEKKDKLEYGTGFFCHIPKKNIKVLISCNHLLDKNFIKNHYKLVFYTYKNEKKEINLENRYKITDKDNDFTLFEILKGDNIEDYLEIDKNIFSSTYKNKEIFIPQFPNGEKIGLAKGKILPNDNYNEKYIIHSIGTDGGSSGSPLLLTKNKKIIAVHKGRDSKSLKYAIPMNIIVNSIFSIVCVYNITEKHVGKEVQIINNKYYDYYLNEFKCVNNQLKNQFKIIINGKEKTLVTKYKFKKKGKYIISFLLSSKSTLTFNFHNFIKYNVNN